MNTILKNTLINRNLHSIPVKFAFRQIILFYLSLPKRETTFVILAFLRAFQGGFICVFQTKSNGLANFY